MIFLYFSLFLSHENCYKYFHSKKQHNQWAALSNSIHLSTRVFSISTLKHRRLPAGGDSLCNSTNCIVERGVMTPIPFRMPSLTRHYRIFVSPFNRSSFIFCLRPRRLASCGVRYSRPEQPTTPILDHMSEAYIPGAHSLTEEETRGVDGGTCDWGVVCIAATAAAVAIVCQRKSPFFVPLVKEKCALLF